MESPVGHFRDRTILLGVTGGIAAYKVVDLASRWTQRGARVRVLMTPAATRFVTPLTFQSVTRQPVSTKVFMADESAEYRPEHIDLGFDADVFVVAPASADFIGRHANGLADDIVTLALLAHEGPVIVAPAMNDRMWAHPAVQANVKTLESRDITVMEPSVGHLACGSYGAGRLAELDSIDELVSNQLMAQA